MSKTVESFTEISHGLAHVSRPFVAPVVVPPKLIAGMIHIRLDGVALDRRADCPAQQWVWDIGKGSGGRVRKRRTRDGLFIFQNLIFETGVLNRYCAK